MVKSIHLKILPSQCLPYLALSILILAILLQGFNIYSQVAIHSLQLLCLAVLISQSYQRNIIILKPWLFSGLLGLTVWMVISTYLNPVKYSAINGLFLFMTFALWLAIGLKINTYQFWKAFTVLFFILVIISSLFGLSQYFIYHDEPTAFFVQRNTHACFLNFIVIYLITVRFRFLRSGRLFYVSDRIFNAGIFLTYLTLFTIAGRAALLANLAGFFILFSFTYRLIEWRKVIHILMLIMIAYLVTGYFNDWQFNERITKLEKDIVWLTSESDTQSDMKNSSLRERLLIWQATWQMLQDTPWYGSGLGTFHMRYPAYQSPHDTSAGQYVHNDYLQIWLELGWPGLLMVLLLMGYILFSFIKASRSRNIVAVEKIEMTGLFAAISAVAIHNLFSYNFYVIPILMLLGLFSGRFLSLISPAKQIIIRPDKYIGKKVFTISLCFVLLVPFYYLFSNLLMNYHYEKGKVFYEEERFSVAEQEFAWAESWFNTENIQIARASIYLSAAKALDKNDPRANDFLNWAMQSLSKAETMNPYQAQVNYLRGLFYEEYRSAAVKGWAVRAEDEYLKVLKKNLRHYESRFAYARLVADLGYEQQAWRILEEGLIYPFSDSPDIKQYILELIRLRKKFGDHAAADKLSGRLQSLETRWARRYPESL